MLLFTLTFTARQNLTVAVSAVLQTISGYKLFSSHAILFLLNMMGLCDCGSNSDWYMDRSVDWGVDRGVDRDVDSLSNCRSHSDWSVHRNLHSLCDAWLNDGESMSVTVVRVSVVLLLETFLSAQKMLLVLLTHLEHLLPILLQFMEAILSFVCSLVELSNTHLCNASLLFKFSCAPLSFHSLALGTCCALVSSICLANSFLFNTLSLFRKVCHVFLQAGELRIVDFLVAVRSPDLTLELVLQGVDLGI